MTCSCYCTIPVFLAFANKVFHEQVLKLLGPPYLKFYKLV